VEPLPGTVRLACELTLREGEVVYDLNGIAAPDWKTLPRDYGSQPAPR
jgi:dihydroorotase